MTQEPGICGKPHSTMQILSGMAQAVGPPAAAVASTTNEDVALESVEI